MIPQRLSYPAFRFVLLQPKEKKPFEKNWTNNGYTFDSPKLKTHIETGGNYGVIGGYGNLRMIDIDDQTRIEEIAAKIGNTFSVKTGSGGRHFYIFSPYDTNHVLAEGLGEYRAKNYQVVGPGSTHPNGNTYEIVSNEPIKEFTTEEIQALLKPYLRSETKAITEENSHAHDESRSAVEWREVLKLIRKGRDDEQINKHMTAFSKWSTSSQQYRDFTIKKARNYVIKQEQKRQRDYESTLKTTTEASSDEQDLQNQIYAQLARRSKEGEEEARELFIQYISKNYHLLARRNDFNTTLYIYDKNIGIYVPHGRSHLRNLIERICGKAFRVRFTNEVIERAIIRNYVSDEELFKVQDPYRIVVENGALHLLEKKLTPFNPEHKEFLRIPIRYDPLAKSNKINDFLKSCGHDEKTSKQLIEFIAYTLVRHYHIPRALIMNGAGRNGKEVFGWVQQKFVGLENVANIGLHEMNEQRFSKASLQHKLLNISGELPERDLETSQTFKEVTGETRIQADVKHESAVNFTNYAKLVFACNQLPKAVDQTRAFWYRLLLITWTKTFVTKEEYEALSEAEKPSYGIKDPDLKEKLTTPQELSAILNQCLEVLPELIERGDYYGVQRPEEVQALYNKKSNDVEHFWEECVDYDAGTKGDTKETIFDAYERYCREELHVQPKQNNSFWRKSKETADIQIIRETIEDSKIRVRRVSGWVVKSDFRGSS